MTKGFWDFEMDEGGLPVHLPMGVDSEGRGPMEPEQPHHYECWCIDRKCPLTLALQKAWDAGRIDTVAQVASLVENLPISDRAEVTVLRALRNLAD